MKKRKEVMLALPLRCSRPHIAGSHQYGEGQVQNKEREGGEKGRKEKEEKGSARNSERLLRPSSSFAALDLVDFMGGLTHDGR